jgi:hypothetical protein
MAAPAPPQLAAPLPGIRGRLSGLMPGKKPPEAWEVILEEIRSQNRGTIEAVESKSSELKRGIAELREDTGVRLQTLESAVRQNSTDIQALQGDVRNLQKDVRNLADKVEPNSADIRCLDEKVDNLSGLEVRVRIGARRAESVSDPPTGEGRESEQWLKEWVKLGEAATKGRPQKPTATEILAEDRRRASPAVAPSVL